MAYPFLPVNPCCTDVVINDPCGCNSVITNTGCNNNNPCSTHLTASSTIVYDGPALSCTTAEPCDTLNVILQKIDEIICNLLTQINILTIQVNNITTQIITINGDIININNQLDVCCNVTTTTTSTTVAPCESFSLDNTGEDPVGVMITNCDTGEQEIIVLLPGVTNICVQTDSPLTVPGTVIVTPNGPCGPTTTTTTTLIPPSTTTTTTTVVYECQCFTFYNDDVVAHVINYKDCDNINVGPISIDPNETIQVCGGSGSASDPLVTISVGADCIDGSCPTTTTTTTIAECTCYNAAVTISQEVLDVTDNGQIILNFNDCDGNPQENIYDTAGFYLLGCVNFIPGIDSTALIGGEIVSIAIGPVTIYEQCCPESPTTSTTTTAIPPTTTTTTTVEPTTTTTSSSSTSTTTTTTTTVEPTTTTTSSTSSSTTTSTTTVEPTTTTTTTVEPTTTTTSSSSTTTTTTTVEPTTTTTTTVEPTTTTTTIAPTTTTTTTPLGECLEFEYDGGIDGGSFVYTNCILDPEDTFFVPPNETGSLCAISAGTATGTVTLTLIGNCPV